MNKNTRTFLLDRKMGKETGLSVAVKGVIFCEGDPDTTAVIELWEKEIIFHRKLDEVKTNSRGFYQVSGSAKEATQIDPQLRIFHTCNHNMGDFKEIRIDIPSQCHQFSNRSHGRD
ncbi:unnamed protein product [Cylicocyclus nassatus]|uniref:Transthyretin-like family protein n=1 Tax=Cylicocyclus nassatus TaxID=53992 RepID=A0AA36H8Q1_CYLNA|nr:unnamed protein product [Cylicocyclus nassatus]